MPREFTTVISENECIGDSLNTMNLNWDKLDNRCQILDTKIASATAFTVSASASISPINVTDTNTIDLTWTNNTRTIQADVKTGSLSAQQLSLSAVRALALFGEQGGDSCPIFAARAWVAFNGTTAGDGAQQTILGSGNVLKVERFGTNAGQYVITFKNPIPHTSYACIGGGYKTSGVGNADATPEISFSDLSQSSVKMGCQKSSNEAYENAAYLTAVFFG